MQRKLIVQISDAKVSNRCHDVLVTYSLGSCVGVCLYDHKEKIGGMLHYQLPTSKIDPKRAEDKPFMFADTGLKLLIDKLISMGANKRRMQIKAAGGSSMQTGPQGFDIGKRNHLALRKILWQNGMFIDSEDIGGQVARNMYLDILTGNCMVKTNSSLRNL